MGKCKPVRVADVTFASKDALTAHMRELIGRYAIGFDVEGPDFEFCMALFRFHPDAEAKLLSGVKRIEVRQDRYGNKHFQVHRNDGSDDDISWTWCVRHAAPAVL